jgi:hypothetical protein
MSSAEHAFLEFLRTGAFGSINAETSEAELIQMLPALWKPAGILPPYVLLEYENLEFTFESERLRQIQVLFRDSYNTERWFLTFDVQWYDFIKDFDVEAMRRFLEQHAIAHSCFYFIDDSILIQISNTPITLNFWPQIDTVYRYYMGVRSWRGDSAVTKIIDFPSAG